MDLQLQAFIGEHDFETRALEAMRKWCGADKSVLLNHQRDGGPGTIMQSPFLTPREQALFDSEYAHLNPFIEAISRLPVGGVLAASEVLRIRQYRRHPYYAWVHHHFSPYEAGSLVCRSGNDSVVVSFARDERTGDLPPEQLQRVRAIYRPFRRAYLLHRRLSRTRTTHSAHVRTLLDLTDDDYACFVLAGDGTMLEGNSAADEMLAERTLVTMHGRCIRFVSPIAQARCAAVLRRGDARAIFPAGSTVDASVKATLIFVADMAVPASAKDGAQWMLFERRTPAQRAAAHVQRFAETRGLTAAEAELLAQLVNGLALADIATQLRRSLEMCRTLLKQIYAKTGTRRQAELVAQVFFAGTDAGGREQSTLQPWPEGRASEHRHRQAVRAAERSRGSCSMGIRCVQGPWCVEFRPTPGSSCVAEGVRIRACDGRNRASWRSAIFVAP